jgi:hypothetical protein
LGISPLSEKITEYRDKWEAHLQRMENTRFALQVYKYQPSGKRDTDRPRRRWRHNNTGPEQEILLIYEVVVVMMKIVT